MKRVIPVLLVIALALGMFAGCGQKENPPAPESKPAAEKTADAAPAKDEPAKAESVNLKWAIWDLDATAYYIPLVEAYVAKNPHVSIEYIDLGSADFMTMLSTQLSGGADLDVLTIKDIPGYANLVKQNHLEPLNSYISSQGIDTSLYGGTTE